MLHSIVATPSAGRVHIVAHSMGTMLTLESLRQLYAKYGDTVADRIGSLVFAAPDIDMAGDTPLDRCRSRLNSVIAPLCIAELL